MPWSVRNRLQGFDLAISFLSDPDAIIARNLAAAGVKQVVAFTAECAQPSRRLPFGQRARAAWIDSA